MSPPRSHFSFLTFHDSFALNSSLRRSYTFWFGLFGLLFLLFASFESTRNGILIAISSGSSTQWEVRNAELVLSIERVRLVSPTGMVVYAPTTLATLAGRRRLPSGLHPPIPRALSWRSGVRHKNVTLGFTTYHRRLDLPHWLIILAYLLLWSALLAWRWRRFAKAATALEEPPGP